jgi:spermidine/putrescine transport system ATP-binding protein
VTHDQEEAMTMSDRIAVMRAGKVLQIGSPEDVYERPATEFVAGFLGASNLLDAEIKDRHGDATSLFVEGGFVVGIPSERLDSNTSKVKLGVRPEKIRLEPTGDAPAGYNRLPGTLRMATFVGIGHHYEVEGPAGKTLTIYEQNVGGRPVLRAGDSVSILWRPEDAFVVVPDQPDQSMPAKEEAKRP